MRCAQYARCPRTVPAAHSTHNLEPSELLSGCTKLEFQALLILMWRSNDLPLQRATRSA